ncbi:MAG TPA: alternative ribosome rescue aminoacyl-tRNA hydrolase ArfB [Spirochaetia bacterium]|nr:alternative ribosome rescue aminoacyl-tRNA hydrolase ArfB [Spirochaetia bacterium]
MTHREAAALVKARGSFTFARAGGPGGQNVNKVSSKVVARLPLEALEGLDGARRALVESRLASRISADRCIVLSVQDTREQSRNREIAVERLADLIARAAVLPKRRGKTRPTRASREARLRSKRVQSERKRLRRSEVDD